MIETIEKNSDESLINFLKENKFSEAINILDQCISYKKYINSKIKFHNILTFVTNRQNKFVFEYLQNFPENIEIKVYLIIVLFCFKCLNNKNLADIYLNKIKELPPIEVEEYDEFLFLILFQIYKIYPSIFELLKGKLIFSKIFCYLKGIKNIMRNIASNEEIYNYTKKLSNLFRRDIKDSFEKEVLQALKEKEIEKDKFEENSSLNENVTLLFEKKYIRDVFKKIYFLIDIIIYFYFQRKYKQSKFFYEEAIDLIRKENFDEFKTGNFDILEHYILVICHKLLSLKIKRDYFWKRLIDLTNEIKDDKDIKYKTSCLCYIFTTLLKLNKKILADKIYSKIKKNLFDRIIYREVILDEAGDINYTLIDTVPKLLKYIKSPRYRDKIISVLLEYFAEKKDFKNFIKYIKKVRKFYSFGFDDKILENLFDAKIDEKYFPILENIIFKKIKWTKTDYAKLLIYKNHYHRLIKLDLLRKIPINSAYYCDKIYLIKIFIDYISKHRVKDKKVIEYIEKLLNELYKRKKIDEDDLIDFKNKLGKNLILINEINEAERFISKKNNILLYAILLFFKGKLKEALITYLEYIKLSLKGLDFNYG